MLLIHWYHYVSQGLFNTNIIVNWLEGKPGIKDEPQHISKGKYKYHF